MIDSSRLRGMAQTDWYAPADIETSPPLEKPPFRRWHGVAAAVFLLVAIGGIVLAFATFAGASAPSCGGG
jgi:hypothetical protein